MISKRRPTVRCLAIVLGSTLSLLATAQSAGAAAPPATHPTTTTTTAPVRTVPTKVAPKSPASSSSLPAGATLQAGHALVSSSQQYELAMQTDGNLVLYGPHGAIWWTGTQGQGGTFLAMQTDGNLVLYGPHGAVWSTSTDPAFGISLNVTNAGTTTLVTPGAITLWTNGVLSGRSESQLSVSQTLLAGQALISSNGTTRLAMQTDGNLVLYGARGAIWASWTVGKGAKTLIVQGDGNVVLYSAAGKPVWASWTVNRPVTTALVEAPSQFVLTGPEGPLWSNGKIIEEMPSNVGVYAYPDSPNAIAQGWPIIGDTGALGSCGAPFTGYEFSPNDEATGAAIQASARNIPWLSFWTVSGPTTKNCVATANQSPAAFYAAGKLAGQWVAHAIDAYPLRLKPTDVILDPEGWPDNHSGLDGGINNANGPSTTQIALWTHMLAGWKAGIASVDPTLTAAFYADQAEYTEYHLASSTLPAFIAVAFGYQSGLPSTTYPMIDPARLSGTNGANIKGFIAFFANAPNAAICGWAQGEANFLASWGAALNTLQFNPGQSCQP